MRITSFLLILHQNKRKSVCLMKEYRKENKSIFESYNTPHNTVPFHRIKLEDYEEAFMEGIRRDDESTDKLINDPAEPTFENTIARVDTERENIITTF